MKSSVAAPDRYALFDLTMLLALSSLWGASYTFIRIGVATIPPITLIALRTLIAGLLLSMWILMRGIAVPRDLQTWWRFLIQSLLNSVLPFTLIAWAEQSVPAALATILNSTSPIFTFAMTWLVIRHEPVSSRKLFGVIMGLFGICLIVGTDFFADAGTRLLPQLAIVAATVCYSGAAIYGRSFAGLSPVVPAAGSLLVGAAILAPVSLMVDHPWTLHPSVASMQALAALAILSTALAFVIYFHLIKTLGSVATSAQAYLRVPVGVALGVAFLTETIGRAAWIGLVCVVVAVVAMTLPPRSRRNENKSVDG